MGFTMAHNLPRKIAFGAGIALVAVAVGGGAALMNLSSVAAQAESGAVVPAAVQASVALVEAKATAPSDEFSGRLEAIERVEIRSRVAGAVQEIHFREGALVKKDDLLVLIDPALYAADVDRAQGQVSASRARLILTKADFDRGQQLTSSSITQRDLDNRINAYREAEANLKRCRSRAQDRRAQSQLHRSARAGRGPCRQGGDHRRQPDCGRARPRRC